MMIWKRTLRTSSSERFLATRDGKDVAAVDLHYLANGTVSGTVVLLKEAGWKEADIPQLLQSLDRVGRQPQLGPIREIPRELRRPDHLGTQTAKQRFVFDSVPSSRRKDWIF